MRWSATKGVSNGLGMHLAGTVSKLTLLPWALLFTAILGAMPSQAQGDAVLIYPHKESALDSRYDYDWAVLRTALDKTKPRFGPYEMRPSTEVMGQARVVLEMQASAARVNIFARATAINLEQQFIPVRIPIERGLLGYRLLLARSNELPRLAGVRNPDDLRQFSIGLGKGWIDAAILRAAGFRVVEGDSYDGLFSMLTIGRFDVFSRSIDEAWREYDERHDSHPDIAVEPTLLIYCPLPRYFFLRRDAQGEQLAKRIETGMEMMVRDGSLQKLFHQFKDAEINRAALGKRRLLRIPNRLLPPETPLNRPELWYDPFEKVPAEAK